MRTALAELLETLGPATHRAVRDLAWACFSPALPGTQAIARDITQFEPGLTDSRRRWLIDLAADPAPLLAHLADQPGKRLGLYFEALWHYFLQQDGEIDLIAHNLPVRADGRTIGEFDCLYFCRERQRTVHLELAVKFYLAHQGRWLGANTRDRLDLKLAHIEQSQIRLGDHPAAARLLRSMNIDDFDRQVAIKGRLFHRWPSDLPTPLFAAGNPPPTALWLTWSALLTELMARPASTFVQLDKAQWFAEITEGDALDASNNGALAERLAEHFESVARPLQLVAQAPGGREYARFFVTPDSWPELL